MMDRGSHLNAMGAIVPSRVEFTEDVFSRADILAVDSIQSVKDLSTEFRQHFADNEVGWGKVEAISSIIAGGKKRPPDADITLFKAMGMGLSDLALALEILNRARAKNRGHKVPDRIKIPPRLT